MKEILKNLISHNLGIIRLLRDTIFELSWDNNLDLEHTFFVPKLS
jgi:hypothetical protein